MDRWDITSLSGCFYHSVPVVFGLLAGSFLNVVVYRIPLTILQPEQIAISRFNLSFPCSHCPICKHPLKCWQNIPLIGWVVLKGRCFYCHDKISVSYPLTEGFCAMVFFGLSFVFPTTFALCCGLILFSFLLALSLIDLSALLLPDCLTLPLLWIGLLAHSLSGNLPLQDALLGAVTGYLFLWSLYWGVKIVTDKEGIGYGDFKLLAALGAWVGWQMLPYLCILAGIIGIAFTLVRFGINSMSKQIPFGPSLSFAGMLIYISQESELVWLMFK